MKCLLKFPVLFFLLNYLNINGQIVDIPDPNFKKLLLQQLPVIDINGDNEIQLSEAESATEVLVVGVILPNDEKIKDITGIEAFINVERLLCYGNLITEMDISNLTKLKLLNCARNNLTYLDVSKNPDLHTLLIGGNLMPSIDISANTKLEIFSSINGELTSIDLSNNLQLKSLSLAGLNISEVDLKNNIQLELLRASRLKLKNLDIAANINLQDLRISENEITELDLQNNSKLESIDCSENFFRSINFSLIPRLKRFIAHQNLFESLDLSSCTLLNTLYISDNPILQYVNIKNGYNEDFAITGNSQEYYFFAENCPSLEFICVDNVEFAESNFTNVDSTTQFISDCDPNTENGNLISGIISYDNLGNNCTEDGTPIKNKLINAVGENESFGTFSNDEGYTISVPTEGQFDVIMASKLPDYMDYPNEVQVGFSGVGESAIADFCIQTTDITNLTISLIPITDARPGFESEYYLVFENLGGNFVTGEIELNFDGQALTFISANENPTTQIDETLIWNFIDFPPFSIDAYKLKFLVEAPPLINGGYQLLFTGLISPIINDHIPEDNEFNYSQTTVNAYDPNDITVFEGETITLEEVQDYLNYRIRFQNLGTASAINVKVENMLNANLDWTTLQITGASHDYQVSLKNKNQLIFEFNNIDLPEESVDSLGSQGYITYRIKPYPDFGENDVISNNANIIFDFNEPILTNTVETRLEQNLSVLSYESENYIIAYPNPTSSLLYIKSKRESNIKKVTLYSILGNSIEYKSDSSDLITLDLSGLSSGLYILRVEFLDNIHFLSKISKN